MSHPERFSLNPSCRLPQWLSCGFLCLGPSLLASSFSVASLNVSPYRAVFLSLTLSVSHRCSCAPRLDCCLQLRFVLHFHHAAPHVFCFFSEYRSLLQIISLAKMCTFPSLCPVEYSLAHFLKLAGSEHLRVLFWLTVSFFKNWSQLVGMRQSVI